MDPLPPREAPEMCTALPWIWKENTVSQTNPPQQINHEIYRNDSFIYYFNLQRSDSGHAIKGEITLREGLTINGAYISKACAYDQILRPME